MGKAIGIGGVFIKYKDESTMKSWFESALRLTPNDYGVLFSFNGSTSPKGFLQLGIFPIESEYFGRKEQQFMINFRVENLEELVIHLKAIGTVICDELETYDYGKFIHIEDPEGNRIELWEPIDSGFETTETFVEMK